MQRHLMALALLAASLTAHAARPDCVGPATLATCRYQDGSVRTIVRLPMSEVVQSRTADGGSWTQVTHVLRGGAVLFQRGTNYDGSVWWKTITPDSWSDETGRWTRRTDGSPQ